MELDIPAPITAQPSLLIPFLMSLPGLGVARYWQLRQQNLPLDRLLTQPLESLLPMIPAAAKAPFRDFYDRREQSDVWRRFEESHLDLQAQGVEILNHEDLRFPTALANISQCPPVLYVKGPVELLDSPQLAFVGSRNASHGACQTSSRFAHYLVSVGITITSGLAVGIDGAAHQGAINGGGKTIAVMGTGIDRVYPLRHKKLAADILASGGALVSEFLPGTAPHSGNFPRRNRIISGLSLGVLVVEAAIKSGSLITARYALEHNREVFAIPGSIHNPLSRGCHALIRDGATLVETAEDIAAELSGWCERAVSDPVQSSVTMPNLSESECEVLEAIEFDSCNIDELSSRVNLATSILLAILMQLELKGLIGQTGGRIERLAP